MDERWQAVAKAVKQRRAELGLTREQAVARSGGGVSPAVWTLIEGAKQDRYKDRTLEAVCRALGWPASAIEWIYEGDNVDTLNEVANSGGWTGTTKANSAWRGAIATDQEDVLPALERRLASVEQRLAALEDARNATAHTVDDVDVTSGLADTTPRKDLGLAARKAKPPRPR